MARNRVTWTAQSPDPVDDEVTDSARRMVDGVAEALPRIGVALGIVVVGYVLSRLIRWVLHGVFARGQTPSFATVMSKLIGWVFLASAVLGAIAITIRETRITTYDGQTVIIPNRDVHKSVIRVQTHHERRRLDVTPGGAVQLEPADRDVVED